MNVSKALAAKGEEVPFSLKMNLADTALMNEPVEFSGAALLTGTCASIGDSLMIRGNMAFTAKSRCVLCLKSAEKSFVVPFDALYGLVPDPANPDQYVYDGAWVDPMEMAADAALLALPMQWRCKEDCKGLCPACGADRNETECSCRMEMPAKAFAALRPLRTEDESEV